MTETREEFRRVLGLPTAVLLVAGIMIGSGVFKKIVPMAQTLPDQPLIIAAWIVAGVITIFGAFTYAGLATMTSDTGGVYEYLRLIYGEFISFLFGWTSFMIFGGGALAALAFVFSQSVNTLLPLPFGSWGIKGLAVATIWLLTWFNCRGIRKGGILNNIVTSAKIIGILFLIVTAIFFAGNHVTPDHLSPNHVAPLIPVAQAPESGWFSAFFGAMLSALWAYDGWANITYITGEIRNPQRNVPYAIIGGVGIAIALYVLLNVGYMRVLPLNRLAALGQDRIAAAEVARAMMGNTGAIIIGALIMTCTFSALNGCVISYPRIYFRMAQENMFFRHAARVNPITRTPNVALIYSAAWSTVLVSTGTFDEITNLIVFSSYGYFGLAAFGVVRMRRTGRITAKVIGYPVIPWLIILFCGTLMINTVLTQPGQSLKGLLLIASGVPFYLYFKRRQATEQPFSLTDQKPRS